MFIHAFLVSNPKVKIWPLSSSSSMCKNHDNERTEVWEWSSVDAARSSQLVMCVCVYARAHSCACVCVLYAGRPWQKTSFTEDMLLEEWRWVRFYHAEKRKGQRRRKTGNSMWKDIIFYLNLGILSLGIFFAENQYVSLYHNIIIY